MSVIPHILRPTLRVLGALSIGVLSSACLVAFCSYRASCAAADAHIADASDGPWVRSKVGFVIDIDPDAAPIAAAPHWIFRFRNLNSDSESKRIYVTFFGDRAFSYTGILDPLPVIGALP